MSGQAMIPAQVSSRPWASGEVFGPDPALLRAYMITAVLTGPLMIVFIPYFLARYHTLRYRLDSDGVWMGVGLLFRKESNIAYRRMQDVQLTRGLLQRWLGLSTVAIQTASGSSTPEISIEGVRDGDGLRDVLYSKMRGADEDGEGGGKGGGEVSAGDEVLALLREVRDLLRGGGARGGPCGGVGS